MNTFGQPIPVRDDAGNIIGVRPSEASRRTKNGLSGSYGPDRDKRLIVSLRDGDIIAIRPERTRREVTVTAHDLYATMLRWQANRVNLEKARERKERASIRREALAIKRTEDRIRREARKEKESAK